MCVLFMHVIEKVRACERMIGGMVDPHSITALPVTIKIIIIILLLFVSLFLLFIIIIIIIIISNSSSSSNSSSIILLSSVLDVRILISILNLFLLYYYYYCFILFIYFIGWTLAYSQDPISAFGEETNIGWLLRVEVYRKGSRDRGCFGERTWFSERDDSEPWG